MRIPELRALLAKHNVHPSAVAINGENSFTEQYRLEKESRGNWVVYYSERGQQVGLRQFFSEEEACECLVDILIRDRLIRTLKPAARVVLVSRPVGEPSEGCFRIEQMPVPVPGPGEMLLRTLWLSLDPYMRGRMSDAPSYAAPVQIGQVMEGRTVSEVIASNLDGYAPGDIVLSPSGWQTHAISQGKLARKIDPSIAPVSTALGVLGMPGMTAYTGLSEIGQPKAGETVVVSAASGAVGSLVGQIAKIKGARAVGIAGGPAKCRYVVDELGFDACVDHRAGDLAGRLKAACPNGVDVYFENVGGPVFEAVFPLLNSFARVPVCGQIATYNATEWPAGELRVSKLTRDILTKRLTFRGFIVSDFAARQPDFLRDVSAWLREGRIRYREDVVDGLEKAPRALIGLLRGENFGKLLVRVAAPRS